MDRYASNRAGAARHRTGVLVVALIAALLAPIVAAASAGAEFLQPRISGAGTAPKAVGLGDFNGDGELRAAMLVPGESYVVTMDPFTAATDRHTTGSTVLGNIGDWTPIGVGDIDHDGRDDLVARFDFGFLHYQYYWPGQADGNFGNSIVMGLWSSAAETFAVGDFIGSAADEVLRMYRPGATVTDMEINFRGVSETSPRYARRQFDVARVRYLLAGDFIAGGDDEALAFYDYGSSFNGFLYDAVEGEVTSQRIVVSQDRWGLTFTKEMGVGDFNGDGIDDVVALHEPSPNLTRVYVMVSNSRQGGLDAPVLAFEFPDAFNADGTGIFGSMDVNGDGYEDVIAHHGNRPLRLYGAADGMLTFDPPTVEPQFCHGLEVTVSIAHGEQPTNGDDVIMGTNGPDEIAALGGDDTICGLGGDDRIFTGGGRNWVHGGGGDDVIVGGSKLDRIKGGPGNDTISGRGGSDRLKGGSGMDEIVGNRGNDRIWGGSDDDILQGNRGRDRIRGGAGDDLIQGNGGADDLGGGRGDDDCSGGPGADRIRSDC